MSLKSILLSIFAMIFMVGFLFVIVFLFGINVVLGIVGIVVWLVVLGILWRKALDAAKGVVDKVLAKYVFPILTAFLVLGAIMYIVYNAIVA